MEEQGLYIRRWAVTRALPCGLRPAARACSRHAPGGNPSSPLLSLRSGIVVVLKNATIPDGFTI